MAKSDLPLSSSFVAEFCQRLSRQSPVLHLARSWLEQRLVEQGLSIEQLVQLESQNQAADQVSVSHSIASLRFLSAMDWKEFVEKPESGRGDFALRPGRCLRARWIFRPAIAIAIRSSSWPGTANSRKRSRAARHPTGRRQRPAKGTRRPDRPCGLLSDRQRPAALGANGESAAALANDHRTKHPPFSADVLRGRHRGAHVAGHVRV
jgi:hypothetical protein